MAVEAGEKGGCSLSTIEGTNPKGVVMAHSDRAGYAFNQKAGWLRELERAQWKERLRYQPSATRDNEVPENVEEAAGTVCRGGVPCMTEEPVTTGGLGMAHVDLQVLAAGSAGTGFDVVQQEIKEHEQDGVPAGMASVPVDRGDDGLDVPEHVSRRSLLVEPLSAKSTMAPGEWEKQAIYVVRREDEVRVWLRDSRLDSQKGLEVLERVVAQLRGLGNRRVCLSLNGHEIARARQV